MPLCPTKRSRPIFDPQRDLEDLTGKVVIVTGGNSGIGLASIQHLLRLGAKVYMAARSEARALAAIEQLYRDGILPGPGSVEWLELDLSAPHSVPLSAQKFLDKENRLDILIHNAGVLRKPYWVGPDGIQETMLVNHVSPFILTKTLLPLMIETAKDPKNDVRIVTLTSDTIDRFEGVDIRYRDLTDFNEEYRETRMPDQWRYCRSKLANVLFTKKLQQRLNSDNIPITALAVHPGWVFTDGVSRDPSMRIPILGPLLRIIFRLTFLRSEQGAYSTIFCAASPAVRGERERYQGVYVAPDARFGGAISAPPTSLAASAELAEELWAATEKIVADMGL